MSFERDRFKADILRDMGLIVGYALDRHMQFAVEENGQFVSVHSPRFPVMVDEIFKSVQERILSL